MKYKGFCVIRHKRGNVVGVTTIATMDFLKKNEYYCTKQSFKCDVFEIMENVGGTLIVDTYRKLKYSNIQIKNTIKFDESDIEYINIETHI